ncbi:MAG: Type II secretion system protein E [Holosporales bacterium]
MNDAFLEHLINKLIFSTDHLSILKHEQETSQETLIQIALRLRFIDKNELIKLYANYIKFPYVCVAQNRDNITPIQEDIDYAFIYYETPTSIAVVVEDPLNVVVTDKIKKCMSRAKQIEWFCGNLDLLKNTHQEVLSDWVDVMILEAIQKQASDIHIFSKEHTLDIYFRILGQMVLHKMHHKSVSSKLINRLKILSNLDIANTKTSQSGMFIYEKNQQTIHCRVSFHPSYFGEKINIRLLNPYQQTFDLPSLGFEEADLKILHQALNKQSGLIILTGETGAGKTTTLYACLHDLKNKQLNIMTLEDPIECFLPFATQTQVSSQFNYAQGIRSLLRQDPDVILVGEIRDEETASMAFRAAMTGHLVLTTLHTQSVHTVKDRLRDLGVHEHLIQSFVLLIVNQSLIPVYHDDCDSKGCHACKNTGILKRMLSYEILSIEKRM